MKYVFSYCILALTTLAVLVMNTELISSYALSALQDRNITSQLEEQKCNYNSRHPGGYCLAVTVKGLDKQQTYVNSYALNADGMSIANGTEFIRAGLETKTLPVSLCCTHNASVSQFYTCALKFVDNKMCVYTMTEEEPVLINFNANASR